MSEHVDGVAGRQVGAGDEVLPGGRLHLYPGPALQVAVEAAHLAGRERDVGHAALAAVPGWMNTHTHRVRKKSNKCVSCGFYLQSHDFRVFCWLNFNTQNINT